MNSFSLPTRKSTSYRKNLRFCFKLMVIYFLSRYESDLYCFYDARIHGYYDRRDYYFLINYFLNFGLIPTNKIVKSQNCEISKLLLKE